MEGKKWSRRNWTLVSLLPQWYWAFCTSFLLSLTLVAHLSNVQIGPGAMSEPQGRSIKIKMIKKSQELVQKNSEENVRSGVEAMSIF